jgi:dihydroxyacetone kinase-like protein
MSDPGVIGVDDALRWVRAFAAAVAREKEYLTALDAAIGDADHGINMDRGMTAAVAALDGDAPADVAGVMRKVAMTLISKVGGAGGPLYGSFFLQFGTAASGNEPLTAAGFAECFAAGVEGVRARGKAEPGDKTMMDALIPAAEAMRTAVDGGADLPDALARAADAAEEGATATIPWVARKGRASYLGERSAGHQDPGATSSGLLVRTAAQALAEG